MTGSVGVVTPQLIPFETPLDLERGGRLPRYDLMVETYGTLNAQKSNAVLVCHALSGDHHAAGYHGPEDTKPGWWDSYIGPGKAIDTDLIFCGELEQFRWLLRLNWASLNEPRDGQSLWTRLS